MKVSNRFAANKTKKRCKQKFRPLGSKIQRTGKPDTRDESWDRRITRCNLSENKSCSDDKHENWVLMRELEFRWVWRSMHLLYKSPVMYSLAETR